MKEPWDELEVELRRLRPRPPSELLEARVAAALNAPRPRRSAARWWWAAPLAAAAALALVMSLPGKDTQRSASVSPDAGAEPPALAASPESAPAAGAASTPEPLSAKALADCLATNVVPQEIPPGLKRMGGAHLLYAARDVGVVLTPDRRAFRRIRCQFLDTTVYRDEADQAVLRVVVPKEDVLLVPTQVY
jgi:hypothetical protein